MPATLMNTSVVLQQDDMLLTFKQAMGELGCSRSTLYRLMWSGQLTGYKVGSTWRFYRKDVTSTNVLRPMPLTNRIAASFN